MRCVEALDQPSHSVSRRVQISQSPYLNVFYKHIPLKVVIDSGAETNMIRESVAKQFGASVQNSSHQALQADGQSSLIVTGETSITFNCGRHSFILEALVVSNLECDVLAGVPFMIHNDISIRPSKRLVLVDETVFK